MSRSARGYEYAGATYLAESDPESRLLEVCGRLVVAAEETDWWIGGNERLRGVVEIREYCLYIGGVVDVGRV